jgi:hypothetical protein
MVPINLGTTFARLGVLPFTTVATVLIFHILGHYDESYSGFGVISWFERFFNFFTCNRSQFRFVEYGFFFWPTQGIGS